jgi:hypothetical protein
MLIGKQPSRVRASERADQSPVYDTCGIPSRVMETLNLVTGGQGDAD